MVSGFLDSTNPLGHAHERLQAIVTSAMDAIITIDEQQRIIGFNPAAEQMFRIPAHLALEQPLERFIPHRFRANHGEHIRRFCATGETGRRMGALTPVSALRADGEEFSVEASISHAMAGDERLLTVIMRDITEREANEKARALLAREVDHRAKNTLAIVSSLVQLTNAPTREAYIESLMGRISAMSRAHGLLSLQRWKGAALARVISDELQAYTDPAHFSCNGPDLQLSSRTVQPIGMLFHELATNAVKYGAFSVEEGKAEIEWRRLPSGEIEIRWTEIGGPAVSAPQAPGFGSTLIREIARSQLGGSISIDWPRTGCTVRMTLPEMVLQGDEAEHQQQTIAKTSAGGRTGPAMSEAESAGGTLLIVEDEPLLAMQLTASLKEYGWSVLGVAGSIDDANRILSQNSRPDAAILDVDLGGAPVFPLARSLRRTGIPFLFCTGYDDLGYSSEFANCTAVRKPATALQIVRALRDVVRSSNPQALPL